MINPSIDDTKTHFSGSSLSCVKYSDLREFLSDIFLLPFSSCFLNRNIHCWSILLKQTNSITVSDIESDIEK